MLENAEIKKVSDTIEIVKNNIEEYEILYSNLIKENLDEEFVRNMSKEYSNKLKNLRKALMTPYFARIDFKENNINNVQKIYIGKTGILNDKYDVIVTDWRAPIASIYYDGQLGKVKYDCPEGTIEGDLTKKRVYNIENSELKDYQDIDITTNDEFLQECLNENSEARLKNIISTIQSEQNKIIRAKMSKPLIVQGVAGSGKTTVALHRIAYLVYTYEKEFNPDEFLIIAPNKFFLDYISNVLPDLGVDYVRQQTFEEFMFENIEGNIEIEPVNTELSNIVNKNGNIDLIKDSASFKSSLIFKDIVDEFISDFLNNNLPKEDFKVTDIIIFTNEEIREMFMELFKNNSVNDSKKLLSGILQKRLGNISDELIDRLTNERKKKILQAVIDEYISTAEPVSSGMIAHKPGLQYSSATIRNEMASLEKEGLLEKTHTSSGRVPSEKGYRLYVDELLKEDNISLEEIKYIQSKLEIRVNEIEELTKIASSTLSEITHYTSVAVGPKTSMQNIEEAKFVLLGKRMLMAVILTDSGIIKETIIKFDEDVTEEQVSTLNFIFNNKLKGKPIEEIDKPLEQYIFSEMNYSLNVIKPIMQQLNRAINEEAKLYLEGANKAFELPEFKSLDVAKNFINLIDTKEIMLDLLNTGFANDINVYIGDETMNEQFKDFSIITFKHRYQDKDLGTIGIIGPKRMDYSKVISVMKYISKKLNGK